MNKFKKVSILIWKDPVWSKVIAAAIITLAAYIFVWLKTLTVSQWLTVAVFTDFILAIYLLWPKPVIWNFDWFLGLTGESQKITVFSFQAHGTNKKDVALQSIRGFIKSNITNESIDIFINVKGLLIESSKLQAITPKSSFSIVAPFGPVENGFIKSGRTPEDFLEKFGDFSFVVFVDDKEFVKRFKKKESEKLIEQFRKVSAPKKDTIVLKE